MNSKKFEAVFEDADFRTSSFTKGRPPHYCVAVAMKKEGIAVRDSRDTTKTTLYFTREEWDAFVKGVKQGEFDL